MFRLSKITADGITLYLTIINGVNMLTGNPDKALKFKSAKQAQGYKSNLTQINFMDLEVSL